MIDPSTEKLLTLRDARKHPLFVGGRDLATLYRYSQKGVRGVRLETCLNGGARCTSEEAIRRFLDQQNAIPETPTLTSGQRDRMASSASKKLALAGVGEGL